MKAASRRRSNDERDVLQSALAEYFAPWVQALGLKVEQFDTATYALL